MVMFFLIKMKATNQVVAILGMVNIVLPEDQESME